MSERPSEQLYALLPALYRRRDFGAGEPLRALLAVAERPMAAVERDIEQLYDNWFIETCADWVIPYIGDLLGVRFLNAFVGEGHTLRALTANTLGFRRRKGTVAVLERVAQDVGGWPAAAVEYFQRIAVTQNVNQLRLDRPALLDVRVLPEPGRRGGPFDRSAHTVDVRSIRTRRGLYNLSSVGVFVWTLRASRAERVTASRALDSPSTASPEPGFFRVSPLGHDLALWSPRNTSERLDVRQSAEQVPEPIGRRTLAQRLDALRTGDEAERERLSASFQVFLGNDPDPVPFEQIVVCDLSSWHRPPARLAGNQPVALALDPVLGRLAFPAGSPPPLPTEVRVSYFYGAPGEVGGGAYLRTGPASDGFVLHGVTGGTSAAAIGSLVAGAIADWDRAGPARAVVELNDSRTYTLSDLQVPAGVRLQIRAARNARARPLLAPPAADPTWNIVLGQGASLTLEGLWVSATLSVTSQDLASLELVHCTLVPGVRLRPDGSAAFPGAPSVLCTADTALGISVSRSICGPILASSVAGSVEIEDSVLDAASGDVTRLALRAHGASLKRSTVLGTSRLRELLLAENSLFVGAVNVENTQVGCTRFCFIPIDSRTPRQFRCQPRLALGALPDGADAPERDTLLKRLQPSFLSRVYRSEEYALLAPECPEEIVRGGSDDGEMGAFNFLQQPKRAANLQTALGEYLRFGLEVGVLPALRLRRPA